MCRPYIEFIVKNAKSVAFVCALCIGALVFLWSLPSRLNSCELKISELETRLTVDEREFSTTTTELKVLLAQIQTDLSLIKAKLLK